MALLFIDSFDHYTDTAEKYLQDAGSSIVAGRHGNGRNIGTETRLALNPNSARVIIGAAFNFTSTVNTVYEIHDHDGTWVATVSVDADGSVKVETFGGPSVSSAADVVRIHQWHYLEVDLTILSAPNVTGWWAYELTDCQVLVDGAVVLDSAVGPGQIHLEPITASAYNWRLIHITPVASGTMDDFYVCDGSGAAPHNAPLGDVQIDVIRPNGVGASTEWTAVGAASNWDAVNDLTPDDETTYVSAASASLSDLYAMENVSTDDGILGAQILISARRTEEGSAALAPLLRHAGTTTALTARPMSQTYFYRNRECFVTMPNGDPLTDANVNALQAGMRRTV